MKICQQGDVSFTNLINTSTSREYTRSHKPSYANKDYNNLNSIHGTLRNIVHKMPFLTSEQAQNQIIIVVYACAEKATNAHKDAP